MGEKTMTATEMWDAQHRIDVRRLRAHALLAAVINELGDLVSDQREAHDRLFELFHREGVEMLTDYTRNEIGLPPRSLDGWTDAEIKALEMVRLDLIRPLQMAVPNDFKF